MPWRGVTVPGRRGSNTWEVSTSVTALILGVQVSPMVPVL